MYVSMYELEQRFQEMLEEIYPEPVKVCGYDMDQSRILKELDPTAWRLAFHEYLDDLENSGELGERDGKYYWVEGDEGGGL